MSLGSLLQVRCSWAIELRDRRPASSYTFALLGRGASYMQQGGHLLSQMPGLMPQLFSTWLELMLAPMGSPHAAGQPSALWVPQQPDLDASCQQAAPQPDRPPVDRLHTLCSPFYTGAYSAPQPVRLPIHGWRCLDARSLGSIHCDTQSWQQQRLLAKSCTSAADASQCRLLQRLCQGLPLWPACLRINRQHGLLQPLIEASMH